MPPWLQDLFDPLLTNNSNVWMIALATSLGSFVLFLGLRYVWETFAPPKIRDEAEDPLFVRPKQHEGAVEKLDGAFENLVANTGMDLKVEQATAWIALIAVVSATAFFMLRSEWWSAALGGVLGVAGVFGVFLVQRSRNRWAVQEQLPDVIFMLARSARAGLSLEKSIELIGRQRKLAIAAEFSRCHAQVELGLPVIAALQRTARRLDLLDFSSLASLIALYQTTGGNLPSLLERLAVGTREHNQFRSYVRSSTALGRISAICIAAATPLFLLGYAFWQPEFGTAFFQSQQGWMLTCVCLGVELAGGVWLYRLLKIEY
ncbi:MAG: type II secretion system F family protein [Gemmataceae bacterium]|nr:type II secretion system F family protein [Gemmataceae bacterium]